MLSLMEDSQVQLLKIFNFIVIYNPGRVNALQFYHWSLHRKHRFNLSVGDTTFDVKSKKIGHVQIELSFYLNLYKKYILMN